MRILLVEDDAELRRRLSGRLRKSGFAVDCAVSGAEGRDWPDLDQMTAVLLDLGLPDDDGLDLLRFWRGRGETVAILILTARGNWQDKVAGLNLGADDFLVKPVRYEELLARIHAVARRGEIRRLTILQAGNIAVNPVARIATADELPIDLSRKEFNLLHLFVRRIGHVLSQGEILEQLYALEAERDHNAVEALVSRLRRKIGKERIKTVRGLGYRFDQ